MEENKKTGLPENAHRELKPGEEYKPLLSPGKTYPEVTPYSVSMGLLMTIIFSAAAAFLGRSDRYSKRPYRSPLSPSEYQGR